MPFYVASRHSLWLSKLYMGSLFLIIMPWLSCAPQRQTTHPHWPWRSQTFSTGEGKVTAQSKIGQQWTTVHETTLLQVPKTNLDPNCCWTVRPRTPMARDPPTVLCSLWGLREQLGCCYMIFKSRLQLLYWYSKPYIKIWPSLQRALMTGNHQWSCNINSVFHCIQIILHWFCL